MPSWAQHGASWSPRSEGCYSRRLTRWPSRWLCPLMQLLTSRRQSSAWGLLSRASLLLLAQASPQSHRPCRVLKTRPLPRAVRLSRSASANQGIWATPLLERRALPVRPTRFALVGFWDCVLPTPSRQPCLIHQPPAHACLDSTAVRRPASSVLPIPSVQGGSSPPNALTTQFRRHRAPAGMRATASPGIQGSRTLPACCALPDPGAGQASPTRAQRTAPPRPVLRAPPNARVWTGSGPSSWPTSMASSPRPAFSARRTRIARYAHPPFLYITCPLLPCSANATASA